MVEELAKGSIAAHGALLEVLFIEGNKESVLVFEDGTLLPLRRWAQSPEARNERYAVEVATRIRGQDPFSLLTFGYSGTGPSNYAEFLRQSGFAKIDVSTIVPPVKLRPDGTTIRGALHGDLVNWDDGTASPAFQPLKVGTLKASHAQAVVDGTSSGTPLFERGGVSNAVKFLRTHTDAAKGGTAATYEVYTAQTAAVAREFLLNKNVAQPLHYIVIETPEGNWGRDIDGLYLERLLPWQLDIASAQVEGKTEEGLAPLKALSSAAAGISDNFVHGVVCGRCGAKWKDGLQYQRLTVVRCPMCGTRNRVNSSRFTVIMSR